MGILLIAFLIVMLAACGRPSQIVADPQASPQPSAELVPVAEFPPQPSPVSTTASATVVPNVPDGSTRPQEGPKPITTTFTVSVSPPFEGENTMEQRIADAGLIFIGRLSTVVNTVDEYNFEGRTGYTGTMRFTFSVGEVLKSPPGFTVPTHVVALVGVIEELDTHAQATALSQWLLSSRDSQWDGRDALIFLTNYSLTFPATNAEDLYFLSITDDEHGFGDHYSIASKRNKVWLPEAQTSGSGGGRTRSLTERWFLTDVPQPQDGAQGRAQSGSLNQVESPSIALTNLKAEIRRISAEQGTDTSIKHRYCITRRNLRERTKAYHEVQGREYYAPVDTSALNVEVESGLPAGAVVFESGKAVYGDGWESKVEYLGDDAALFVKGAMTTHYTKDYDLQFSSRAVLKTIKLKAGSEPLLTVRPLPNGVYELTYRSWPAEFLSCDTYFYSDPLIVTVNAPSGTLHEAFFDPVTDGSTVAADSTNGILKPASFTDANSASASLQRIEWASGTVKVKVSPHTGLAGQVMDFIELDGSVSLSLNVDDATIDAANHTLSWTVSSQPWHNGDKLMLRIRKALSAPEDVSVSLSGGTYTISWSAVTGATDYRAQYRTGGSEAAWTNLDVTTGTSQTFSPEGGVACSTTYEFRVQARGDGKTYPAEWSKLSESISHTNSAGACNRPPAFTSNTYTFSVSEGASVWPNSHVVGFVSASDPDEGDFVTYHITAGNGAGAFNISSGHDGAHILVWAALDYETTSSYTLTVEARDGKAGGTSSATVEITVTDVAE